MLACSKWKMRIKKFLVVVPLLLGILFVGDTSAFAEYSTEIKGKDLLLNKIGNSCGLSVSELTDGKENTKYVLKGPHCRTVEYVFDSPVSISGFSFVKVAYSSKALVVDFILSDGTKQTFNYDANNKSKVFIPIKLKNVVSVDFTNEDKLDFMGLSTIQLYEYVSLPPLEIEDLKEKITHNSIEFSYKLAEENFSYMKIFRDGKLIANNVQVENFKDKDLDSSTEYSYKFVSVSPDGIESKGIEKKVKTDEAPNLTKPVKPPTPTINPKDGSLIVNLTNYNAGVKIKGYHIVVDGKQVNDSLVTTRSYAVKGLKNGQTHNVQIKAVSFWNVESDLSDSISGIPQVQVIPDIAFNFGLSDLIESIKNWFAGIWPIIAFSIAIPLAFIVAFNTKKLFLR